MYVQATFGVYLQKNKPCTRLGKEWAAMLAGNTYQSASKTL